RGLRRNAARRCSRLSAVSRVCVRQESTSWPGWRASAASSPRQLSSICTIPEPIRGSACADDAGSCGGLHCRSDSLRLTIPTLLTLLRIVLIPVLVLVFYLPFDGSNQVAIALFVLAAVTDGLDGWVARRWGMMSSFGAFLDPVADKLMVAAALLLIVQRHPE